MNLDLTFKNVCATIKAQGKDDPKLIEAVDTLLGLAVICSPVVLDSDAAALLPTLAVKNELTKIGKNVFERFTKKKDEDYLLRQETMRAAYGLLVFTSFFDALDARLSETLRKEIQLLDSEKKFLAEAAVVKATSKKPVKQKCGPDAPLSAYAFPFPHPTETLVEQCQRQSALWKQMGAGFMDFVQKLAFWDEADEAKRASVISGIDKIEEESARRFEAQYFELARKFEDFAVWANLQAHKGTKALIGDLSDYVKRYAELTESAAKSIDVGFGKLRDAVLSIPESMRVSQATEIAESLNRHYQARIKEPIIVDDKEIGDDGRPRLSFPRVCDAFVPQAFRVLRQAGTSRRLEDESTWSGLTRRNDLGAFLLSYLSSPYSTEAPLLVLGHPGSGKSLLSTILSAQLMSKQFTAIRVPLREVNADADIVTQIEDAIRRITGVSFDSWIKLSALFKNCPPLVILDGYDELLQASGQVFASYIKDAQRFQEREAEQGRPVRVIITSRVTLIDKAAVPAGSTIVRLLEFDRSQRDCWSEIWNSANAGYFRDSGLGKFVLPGEKEKGAEKILNLAEQPLLLLMLALYDSQGNRLRESKGLDRTKLYDSLLRQFVIRERGKEKGFSDVRATEREKALAKEMQRLGVAALGMYNRRKVHILSSELDDDLAFFKLEREVVAKQGKALSQADLLLGSFFFVHKSKAQHSSGAEDTHEETAAFEFLHNTFGEFLTADFVLRRAVAQVKALRAAESSEELRSVLDKVMGTADGFERDWFASLVYTPLFTRPVIMEMIREWSLHVLRDHGLSERDFVETLEKIIRNQIKRLLNKREMPQIMRKETAQEGYRVPFGDHPLVGHIAIYSINLILLRLVTGKDAFVFDEAEVASHDDGTRPWDRLTHVWRSWFSLGNLNGLTAAMLAARNGSRIKIIAKGKIQAEESSSKLQECFNVAVALGDDVAAGIAGLCLFDPASGSIDELNSLEQRLQSEGFDLGLSVSIARLLVLARQFPASASDFARHARLAVQQALLAGRSDQLESVCQIVARTLEPTFSAGVRDSVLREMFDPRFVLEVAGVHPRAARILLASAKRLLDYRWIGEMSERIFELSRHKVSHFDRIDSLDSYEWLQLLREIGGVGMVHGFWGRKGMHPEMMDRLFHPRHLEEFRERSPEAVLTYLQTLKELGVWRHPAHVFERGVPEVLERLFDPRYLLELCERTPEVALSYVRTLKELTGERYLAHLFERETVPRSWDRVHRSDLLEFSERNPEGALAYLQVLKELWGVRYVTKFLNRRGGPETLERMFHPRHLLELSERNPEGTLAYLQILKELDRGQHLERFAAREMGAKYFERMFHVRHLVEFARRSPQGALAYVQVLTELGAGRYLEHFLEREFESGSFVRTFGQLHLLELSNDRISALQFWLAFARLLQSKHVVESLTEVFVEGLGDRIATINTLSLLPISSLADLRWLSARIDNPELQSIVAELTMRDN